MSLASENRRARPAIVLTCYALLMALPATAKEPPTAPPMVHPDQPPRVQINLDDAGVGLPVDPRSLRVVQIPATWDIPGEWPESTIGFVQAEWRTTETPGEAVLVVMGDFWPEPPSLIPLVTRCWCTYRYADGVAGPVLRVYDDDINYHDNLVTRFGVLLVVPASNPVPSAVHCKIEDARPAR